MDKENVIHTHTHTHLNVSHKKKKEILWCYNMDESWNFMLSEISQLQKNK